MVKPDFSGTWRFNPGKSALEIQAPDSTVMVIEHRDPLFRLQRTHVTGGRSDSFSIDLTTDGEMTDIHRPGIEMRARLYWDGDMLVFDTVITRGEEEATNLVRYRLSGPGDSLHAEEHFRSSNLKYDNIWVMDRE